jgi:hypothetical protein
VPLGRNRARPRCTVRCTTLVRPSLAGPRARRTARLGDDGTAPAHGRRRRTAAHRRGDGGAAFRATAWSVRRSERRRRSGRRCGRRGGRGDGGAREAVGRRAARARPAVWTRGVLSRQRLEAASSARRVAASRQRRGAARARRGAQRLTGGARSLVISELKITPKENSSKQIARD